SVLPSGGAISTFMPIASSRARTSGVAESPGRRAKPSSRRGTERSNIRAIERWWKRWPSVLLSRRLPEKHSIAQRSISSRTSASPRKYSAWLAAWLLEWFSSRSRNTIAARSTSRSTSISWPLTNRLASSSSVASGSWLAACSAAAITDSISSMRSMAAERSNSRALRGPAASATATVATEDPSTTAVRLSAAKIGLQTRTIIGRRSLESMPRSLALGLGGGLRGRLLRGRFLGGGLLRGGLLWSGRLRGRLLGGDGLAGLLGGRLLLRLLLVAAALLGLALGLRQRLAGGVERDLLPVDARPIFHPGGQVALLVP